MTTICYMRVSSPKRNGHSRQKTDSQKLALKRYCQNNGIRRPTYISDFSTGRNQNREGFQQVMQQARDGELSCLIVWKLCRLGRSMVETVRTIEELLKLNVKIIVLTQNLTFDRSPFSIFLIQLFSALSELSSNQIAENIRAGLAATTKTLGRPKNEKQRAKIKAWTNKGIAVKEQAKRLKISQASVYAMRARMEL